MRSRRWRRKAGVALLGLAILAPLAAFGISNLYLLSPKGREFLAERIGRRLPFETSVQGCTWSPWNGITVYGLRMEQPGVLRDAFNKPLLSVQSVQIHPDWGALFRKRMVLRGVEIVKPDLCVPLELLSQIPHDEVRPTLPTEPPAIAAVEPEATAPQSPPAAAPPAVPSVGEKPPVAVIPAPEVRTPNVWVHVRDGRLGIVSVMSPFPLFEASGITGSVPISGKPAESGISVARINALGQKAPGKTFLPLKWTSPALGIASIPGGMFGLDFNMGAHIALVPGIPFRIDAMVPEQKDREIRIGGIHATLGKVIAHGRMQGYLQAPVSWQGQWVARTSAVDMEIAGHGNRFDYGQALLLFQNGALRCLDARLSSEDATIIGNGMLLSDGRMAAIARIIAAPDSLHAMAGFTQPDPTTIHLTPLSTPQRAALDLQVFGHLGNLHYKPNPMAAPIPLQ